MTMLLAGLAASTLLSEDAACIAAGLLIQQGAISASEGVAACAAGIYAGDALLWAVGRTLRVCGRAGTNAWGSAGRNVWGRALALPVGSVDSPSAIVASRFIPGTRLPLYLAAGAIGNDPRSFFLWTLLAVLVWTPLIVLGTSTSLVFGGALLALVHVARCVEWPRVWGRVCARLDRWRRWEFWPSWVLYTPVAVHVARLALKHGGVSTLTAANPAIAEGGFVGESKSAILAQLPACWTLRADLIQPGGTEARLEDLRHLVELGHYELPIVLKPDVGQRGAGVRLVRSLDDARVYFREQPRSVLVQQFHAGPFEAGIFYYRRPGEGSGHIFSVTDKRFPAVTGDGRSTVENLIWGHPRYRLQASVFLERHAAQLQRVLADGECMPLALAGNHCQGTMFLDGGHLITPALERRIDDIARSMAGFHIGRFDVRYASVDAFKRGEDLAIVELNGVTSESTNIYDPSFSLIEAWRVLFQQWTLTFEIGAANRERGHVPAAARRLLRLSLEHLRNTPAIPVSS
jgi:membrane protein DedA with SNARE-associated domain